MPNAAALSGDPPYLSEVIEQIGFGPAQIVAGILGHGPAGGAVLLMVSCLATSVATDLGLRVWERGAITSIIFIGVLLGNSSSGPLSDTWGRRGVIILSFVLVFATGVACAFASGFWTLASYRLLLGAAIGLGLPPVNVLLTELTPPYWRIPTMSFAQLLFVFGEIYSVGVVWYFDPTMKHLDWRKLTVVAVLPALATAVLAYPFLTQSPSYLAKWGKQAEAEEVLRSMARLNGKRGIDGRFMEEPGAPASGALQQQLQGVFGWRMLYSTITVTYSCFVLNVLFYGTMYAFPQVIENVDMGTSPAVSVMIGALWEIPGFAVAALCGMWFRRLPVIMFYLVASGIALVTFTVGISMQHMWFSYWLLQAGFICVKFFTTIGFVVVYQYSAEIYPVIARTTGNAVNLSGGRIGAILSPIIFEEMRSRVGNFSSFFHLVTCLAVVNLILVIFLPFETADGSPDDNHSLEVQPIKRKEAIKGMA